MIAKLENQKWYRCRVQAGGAWDLVGNGTAIFKNPFLVLGGEAEGLTADWQVFVTAKTKDRVNEDFQHVFEYDSAKEDLSKLEDPESPIVGKECWAQCDIQAKDKGGFYPPRFGRVMHINDRIPGGAAYKAAVILGNTGTNPPDKEAFRDNF